MKTLGRVLVFGAVVVVCVVAPFVVYTALLNTGRDYDEQQ